MEEDYIDLRAYLDVLLRRRRGIALFAVLLMLVGGLYSLLTPPTYQAATGLVVAPKRADLRLTAVLNLSAEDAQRVDLRYRNAALVEVAGSAEIAQRVMAADPALMDALNVRGPSALVRQVEVEGKDDWIAIQASAPTAELAARLAAAWAHEAEIHINALYAPDSTVTDNLEQESQTALGEYQRAQAEWEAFLGQSRSAELESQIQRLETSLNWATLDMPLANTYRQEALLQQLLLDAEALRQSLQQAGGVSVGNWGTAMSFITLQTQAFGGQLAGQSYQQSSGENAMDLTLQGISPGVWYLDLSAPTPTVTTKDVDALITILKAKLALVQARLATPPAEDSAVQARATQINELAQELTALRLQLEQENAMSRQLTATRDAAWQTYLALVNKLREVQVEQAVTAKEVQVAFEPLPPGTSSAPNTAMNIGLGLVVGVFLGVVWALGQAYLGRGSVIQARTKAGQWLLNASGLPNYPRQEAS